MFRPFKRLENAWNARAPVYLHNGTKENIIFQLALVVLLTLGLNLKEKWDERQAKKRRPSYTEDFTVPR